jgi:CO dehydrogenase maturation factor
MKIAISGKGGTGKTTIAAGLARHFCGLGLRVVGVDADSDTNLAAALGRADAELTPLSQLHDLIEERTGAKPGQPTAFFKMNPHVADIPEEYATDIAGVRLLVLGTIAKGGGGCACPENAFLKALLTHLVLERDEAVITDMGAGIEFLGRGAVLGVDLLLAVVEPGLRSIATARSVRRLAEDIRLTNVRAVGNKIRNDADRRFLEENLEGIPLAGCLSYRERVSASDREGVCAYDTDPAFAEEINALGETLRSAVRGAS